MVSTAIFGGEHVEWNPEIVVITASRHAIEAPLCFLMATQTLITNTWLLSANAMALRNRKRLLFSL
jgi:hypothetical protein